MQHPTRRARRALIAAIGAAATLALATGCAAGASSAPAPVADTPKDGGDVVFLIDTLGDTWVPNNSSISSFQGNIWGGVTDKLVYVDAEGDVSPWIATSWEQNDTATEYTLHLKDGVTFSDGSALDAAAVVANLDIWAFGRTDAGIRPIGLFPKTYDHAEAVDAATVKVVFKAPTLGFIPTLGYHGSILIAPTSLALPVEEQGDLSKDIGSGPFVVESWKAGDSVVLKKRDDYDWGPEAIGNTGAAHLDTVTYKVVAESSVRAAAIESGQADVAFNVPPTDLAALKEAGYTVDVPRYLGFVAGYQIDTRVAPFDDVRVRQALQHAIDRQEILDTVYTSDWQAAQSFIQSNVPESTDHSAAFAFDAAKAAALLDEAGWVAGADGVRTKDGQRLTITLSANPYVVTSAASDELVAQQLKKIGFDVSLQTPDIASFTEKVVNTKGVLAAKPVSRSFIDAGTVASILTSANKGEDWFGVGENDTTLNRLRDEIAQASNTDVRAKALDELQQYVLEQGYFVPLNQIVQRIYVATPELHGVTFNGVAYANFAAAWLDR